jgi:hypothetical protein
MIKGPSFPVLNETVIAKQPARCVSDDDIAAFRIVTEGGEQLICPNQA